MLAVAVVVGAYAFRDVLRIKIASVYVRVTPKPAPPNARAARHAGAFYADAPWALSVVPECLIQTSIARGTLPYVTAHLHGAVRQLPGTILHYHDCTIVVRARPNDVSLTRGVDRLRVPAPAWLYRAGNSISLLHVAGGRAELRTYLPANP